MLHLILYISSRRYRHYTWFALANQHSMDTLNDVSDYKPVVMTWEAVIGLMRRVKEGEDPDMIFAEIFANEGVGKDGA